MKNLIIILCLIATNLLTAQTQGIDIQWFTNLETAKTHAVKNQQNILMVFAGSDWCRPCIQFKNDILQSPDFTGKMADKLTVLYLDFPAKKKNRLSEDQTAHNEALAERFNSSGAFPNVYLVDVDEEVLAHPSYKGQTALEFIQELETTTK